MVEGLTPATEEISDWAELLGEACRLRAETPDVDARATERITNAEEEIMMGMWKGNVVGVVGMNERRSGGFKIFVVE
jgi:hypothetical protein